MIIAFIYVGNPYIIFSCFERSINIRQCLGMHILTEDFSVVKLL
jgi:hypothetical protein